MSRYREAKCKICRRENEKLFLKGERCFTEKCAFERKAYPPGQHGKSAQYRRSRESDFSRQLRAKQKARRIYDVSERQFRRYYATAQQQRGLTGLNLLQILESRLDNVVYRLGFQHYKQICSCNTFLFIRPFEKQMKLFFIKTVHPFYLLFFPKLNTVIRKLSTSALTVLAGWIAAPVKSTLVGITAISFQK